MANAGKISDPSISEYNTEIIVNAGMTDMKSALLSEASRNEELILAPLERNRRVKIRVAENGVLRATDYQE
jgi:hypothetical protein